MFAKTFCKPSSTVSLVPVGVPIKLQYNENGLLQKFSIGFTLDLDSMYEDPDAGDFNYNQVFQRIKVIVPNTITTTGGTTWVYGVLYSDRIPCCQGPLPQALYKDYIKNLIEGDKFEFYAGYVKSLAASFRGPLIIRNYLGASGFNLLPQIVVPLTITEETLQMIMNPSSYPFKYAFVAGFFIFEDLECRYASNNLLQINVTNEPKPFVEADGFIKGNVLGEHNTSFIFNYSELVHHNVSKGCSILLEKNSESDKPVIVCTRLGDTIERLPDNAGHDMKCPICGKVFKVGQNDSPVQCDDPHCLSTLYPDAVKLLETLQLPVISYEKYRELIDSKEIICLTDLLEIKPYKDTHIEATLSKALFAVTPTYVVPSIEFFERLANKCNHSVESLMYYIQNPLRIETDLDITDPIVRRLDSWLNDPYNVSTITTILSRVSVSSKLQKFDGAPIFRGNTIALTGRFKRGDYSEIESILISYAAKVVPSIEIGDDLPDVVVIGSLNDGVSGQLIQKAKIHNIPIIYEDEFFTKYEIDNDLAANLL